MTNMPSFYHSPCIKAATEPLIGPSGPKPNTYTTTLDRHHPAANLKIVSKIIILFFGVLLLRLILWVFDFITP